MISRTLSRRPLVAALAVAILSLAVLVIGPFRASATDDHTFNDVVIFAHDKVTLRSGVQVVAATWW